MARAFPTEGYTMQEVAAQFGVHYFTESLRRVVEGRRDPPGPRPRGFKAGATV